MGTHSSSPGRMKIFILLTLVALALARPAKRSEETWEEVMSMTEADLEEALKKTPKSEIRATAGVLNGDLQEARKFMDKLAEVGEPIKKNGDSDPTFLAAAAMFQEAEDELEDDLEHLPPIPADPSKLHFLGDCIAKAEKTNFDDFDDARTLVNEVITQVVGCASKGVDVMIDATDLDDVADEDITAKGLAGRLEKMRGALIEMGHLAKFVMGFIARLEEGKYGQVSNNDLVKGDFRRRLDLETRLLKQLMLRAGGKRPPMKDDGEDKRPKGSRP